MLSNLPPGVSGFEPEIAGYDEANLYVTCSACEWDGYVDGYWTDRTLFTFTCPVCAEPDWFDLVDSED